MKKVQVYNDILTDEEFEMLMNSSYDESDKVLMKCDRCGIEMELDADILGELAITSRDGGTSCVCMACSLGTMHPVK